MLIHSLFSGARKMIPSKTQGQYVKNCVSPSSVDVIKDTNFWLYSAYFISGI